MADLDSLVRALVIPSFLKQDRFLRFIYEDGEMAQGLSALPEDQGSVPSTYTVTPFQEIQTPSASF